MTVYISPNPGKISASEVALRAGRLPCRSDWADGPFCRKPANPAARGLPFVFPCVEFCSIILNCIEFSPFRHYSGLTCHEPHRNSKEEPCYTKSG